MKRELTINPGYDCRKECLHESKGEHGISSDQWLYVVSDGPRAVTLSVFSADYPATVERATLPEPLRKPWAECMRFHEADPAGVPCVFVEGGLCKADVSYLQARDFWEQHGDPKQAEQGEAFWVALEARR